MVDFTGVTLPFGVGDLLTAAMDLLGLFGPFILLGLAVIFTPKLFGLFRRATGAGGKQ